MNDAIDELFPNELLFKQEIQRVFPGKSFLVIWERPSGVPKGSGPEKTPLGGIAQASLLAEAFTVGNVGSDNDGKKG
jgi:hypothetical protein